MLDDFIAHEKFEKIKSRAMGENIEETEEPKTCFRAEHQ